MAGHVAGLVLVPDRGADVRAVRGVAGPADARRHEMPRVRGGFEEIGERGHRRAALGPAEPVAGQRGDDQDALALVRQAEVERVEDAPFDGVAHRLQGGDHAGERAAPVDGGELADVLDDDGGGPLGGDDAGGFEEQVAARVGEALAVADDAERLAGQAGEQDVVVGDGIGADGGDVAMRAGPEIGFVDGAGVFVDVAGEDAFEAGGSGRGMEPADPAEQISEGP